MSNPPQKTPLSELEAEIANLPAGIDRTRLKLEYEKLRESTRREGMGKRLLRAATPIVVTAGAVFTLVKGITEWGRANREAAEAPFVSALSDLADNSSAAKRAGALATIGEYAERPDFNQAGENDGFSRAERVGMVVALQAAEEPSPALQAIMTKGIADDSTMLSTGLGLLLLTNAGLKSRLEAVTDPPERERLRQSLFRSAVAIGLVLQRLPSEANVQQTVDLGGWNLPDSLALDLHGADLKGAHFGPLNLSGTDFSGSNLAEVDLTEAKLDTVAMTSLCRARNVGSARLPPNVTISCGSTAEPGLPKTDGPTVPAATFPSSSQGAIPQ